MKSVECRSVDRLLCEPAAHAEGLCCCCSCPPPPPMPPRLRPMLFSRRSELLLRFSRPKVRMSVI